MEYLSICSPVTHPSRVMPEEEARKGTKIPRPPWETPLMTSDQLDYFKRGYLYEREMQRLSAQALMYGYESTTVQSTSQDGIMTEPSQPSQPTASQPRQPGIPPLVHLQQPKQLEVSPPLHLQQPRQPEVPIGALPLVSLQQPKQLEVPPLAHLQQAKPLQMHAPTRGPWEVPRPPKRNVNFYTVEKES